MKKILFFFLFIFAFTSISFAQEKLPGIDISKEVSTRKTADTTKLLRVELEINYLDSNASTIKIFAGHGKDRVDLPVDSNLGTLPFEVYKDQLIFSGSLGELETKIIALDSPEKAKEFKDSFIDLLADTKNSKGLIFEFNKLMTLLISKNALVITKD